jgi:hypothetical protein
MSITERRIAELRYELAMLRAALELTTNSADRARIFARVDAAISEYSQLVNARLTALLAASPPLNERAAGDVTE